MKLNLFFVISTLFIISCGGDAANPNAQTSGNEIDLSGYEVRIVPQSDWTHVSRNQLGEDLYEEGYIKNGKKEGTWTTYYPETGYIKSIASYTNGILMGPYIEFDERGRLTRQIGYENNVLSGKYGEFKNGRPVRTMEYLNGLLDGMLREYNNKSQVVKEASYRKNQLDGKVSHYNDEGKLILEYIYKNGEKVSGGIIE